MSQAAITVENISKSFFLKHQQKESYSTLRDTLAHKAKNLFSKKSGNNSVEEFWALKDISFTINEGERVGIIGRNGAGKSTLLKVLSRIITPNKGRIVLEGRVASLLEVGTGFHPELTGRENIFLNGSILGMTKSEIQSKFDEIVAFSEVEKFLDTPVKRYSSGMYVRLAFAVAAHLEPEILIVDEVLAVGDAEFQKKCIGKMKDVSGQGRTVLFVSHNMEAVQKLCNKGIFLQRGQLVQEGTIDNVIKAYNDVNLKENALFNLLGFSKNLNSYATELKIVDMAGNLFPSVPIGESWQAKIKFKLNSKIENFVIAFGLTSALGLALRTTWTVPQDLNHGEYEVTFLGDDIILAEGIYNIVIGLSSNKVTFQYIQEAGYLNISEVSSIYNDNQIVNSKSSLIINQMKNQIVKI